MLPDVEGVRFAAWIWHANVRRFRNIPARWVDVRFFPPGWKPRLYGRRGRPPLRGDGAEELVCGGCGRDVDDHRNSVGEVCEINPTASGQRRRSLDAIRLTDAAIKERATESGAGGMIHIAESAASRTDVRFGDVRGDFVARNEEFASHI